jgi:hypothetical protein
MKPTLRIILTSRSIISTGQIKRGLVLFNSVTLSSISDILESALYCDYYSDYSGGKLL